MGHEPATIMADTIQKSYFFFYFLLMILDRGQFVCNEVEKGKVHNKTIQFFYSLFHLTD